MRGGSTALFAAGLVILGLLAGAVFFPVLLLAGLDPLWVAAGSLAPALLLPLLGIWFLRLSRRKMLFPLLRLSFWMLKAFGRPLRLEDLDPERMLVAVNNRSFGRRWPKVAPSELLLLLPHCLQYHECPHRLTFNPAACRRCGQCTIGDLMNLVDRYGVEVAVATGGTSARRSVETSRPRMILAVACPRDLSLGILDVYPLPVWGQLNQWRHGQCFDTWVDVEGIEAALSSILGPAPVSPAEDGP